MKLVDIVIILILLIVVSLIVYLSFIKNKNNPCKHCVYYKSCKNGKCKNKL